MKIQAIIPTAGSGTRLKADTLKPFVELCGKPLCVYALEAFERNPIIDSVILVGQKERLADFQAIVKRIGLKKVTGIVAGGQTRRESVSNGLAALDNDTEIVVIHDGARPLVSSEIISDVLSYAQDWDAVVSAVPVKSTIKKVHKKSLCVDRTLDRDDLWEVQTPQVFKKDVLLKAHENHKDNNPTDDAAMVEQLGVQVKISTGDYRNIKVTTLEDLTIAEAFLKTEKHTVIEK